MILYVKKNSFSDYLECITNSLQKKQSFTFGWQQANINIYREIRSSDTSAFIAAGALVGVRTSSWSGENGSDSLGRSPGSSDVSTAFFGVAGTTGEMLKGIGPVAFCCPMLVLLRRILGSDGLLDTGVGRSDRLLLRPPPREALFRPSALLVEWPVDKHYHKCFRTVMPVWVITTLF